MTEFMGGPPELLKILIVDDRAENVASLRQVLDRDDLEIHAALSGNEALSLMLDHDFALVLLDVQMPGMDGFEVAELMRSHEKTRTVPIIFVTAINKERQHIFSGYQAGAMDYLFKPVDPFIIRAKVAAFLELKRSQMAREELLVDLNRANARLQEISDLKSDYLSAASHELRTPLTVIKEFCSLVHDEVVGPINEEQRRCLGSAVRNCTRLADLVNDLLDLDSIESGNVHLVRDRVDLAEMLQVCWQDFEGRCVEAGQTLHLELPPTDPATGQALPSVLAASEKITQVVVNLLGNALKFTPAGGEIHVRATVEAGQVTVEVQDDGPGIAPADQQRVFEKFAQLDRLDGPGAKGTGLGLPISRKIIELHGAELELMSEPGQGCLFRFSLPCYTDQDHLQTFVADGTHNPAGLPSTWTLILLSPSLTDPCPTRVLADELTLLVRTSEDRTGLLSCGDHPLHAILLKTDETGARSLLARLRNLLQDKFPAAGLPGHVLLDVSQADVAVPHPLSLKFTPLDSHPVSDPTEELKGVLHV